MRGRLTFAALALASTLHAFAVEPVIGSIEIRTRAPNNPSVKVWYRVPRNYDPQRSLRYRVLVLFGGRNSDGRPEVSGKLGWTEWADLNGIFLVSPTLKDDNYWEPAKWSGRALLDALSTLAARYRIATTGLLFYGYSAGSQASNLFPAWRPDICRAYVSHACGVFHKPSARMRDVAGLVTCGDADTARYVLSREFVGKYRSLGMPVVWKSFPNHPHDVPPGSIRLAKEFLAHYHWSHPEDLGGSQQRTKSAIFVGDDADGVYYRAESSEAADVMSEDRVLLPSESVSAAWGLPGRTSPRVESSARTAKETIDGVEVVYVVPDGVRNDSRILVLFGGRGWPGEKSIAELGFKEWAIARNWCIVAPSFSKCEYWEPQSGSAAVVAAAVDSLRAKHSLRPLPVFLFGYSAGGQLVALLQDHNPSLVAAWAVYGCGLYPDAPKARAPGFVACGMDDAERLRISRDFAYRYREAGGLLLWKPVKAGHELNSNALALSHEFFTAVAHGAPCSLWGEDDTRQIKPCDRIDAEFRNPLYNSAVADLWRR